MPFALAKADSEWTLTLSGVVDIFDAAALHAAVVQAPGAAPGGVVVGLAAATVVDGSITQVLLALRRALVAQGKVLRLEGAPAGIVEAWRGCGLGEELG